MQRSEVYFPNSTAEYELQRALEVLPEQNRLAVHRVIESINSDEAARQKRLFSEPRTLDELNNTLIPEIEGVSQIFFDALRPFKPEGGTFNNALTSTWAKMNDVLREAGQDRLTAFREAMAKAKHFADSLNPRQDEDVTIWPEWDVTRAVGFAVVRGLDPIFNGENPYLVLQAILVLDPSRLQFRQMREDLLSPIVERLFVDFRLRSSRYPVSSRDGELQACLSFGDTLAHDRGDEKVSFIHGRFTDCSQQKPLPSPRVFIP